MGTRIWSGDALVLAHGAVTTFHAGRLWIDVDVPGDRQFTLRVQFETTGGSPRVEAGVQPGACDLVLYDFDGVAGKGSAEPVLLQEWPEDALYVHFRVFRHGQTTDREFAYTFYLSPRAGSAARG